MNTFQTTISRSGDRNGVAEDHEIDVEVIYEFTPSMDVTLRSHYGDIEVPMTPNRLSILSVRPLDPGYRRVFGEDMYAEDRLTDKETNFILSECWNHVAMQEPTP